MTSAWPRSLTRALDGAGAGRRRGWIAFALIAAVVVTAALVAIPLRDAIARAREDVARNRAMLEVARERIADNAALAHANPAAKTADLRGAIDRVFAAHGLRYAPVDAQATDGRQSIVVEAAPFDALVRALDALAHDEGARLVDATLTTRVDPGTVRAELVLAR